MLIRAFRPSDADALATLFHSSVHRAGIRDYSAEKVATWTPTPPDPARYIRQAEERIFLVAVNENGEPIGYGDLEPTGRLKALRGKAVLLFYSLRLAKQLDVFSSAGASRSNLATTSKSMA
jgi:hypothetical protein